MEIATSDAVQAPARLAGRAAGAAQSIWRDAARIAQPSHGGRLRRVAPDRVDISWGWYLGIGATAALGVVEWPIAAVIAVGHAVERHSHSQLVDQLTEGAEEGV